MKPRRQYDEEFKRMAVDLSDAKGSLKATAEPAYRTEFNFPSLRRPGRIEECSMPVMGLPGC